jgi:hypothetical protein
MTVNCQQRNWDMSKPTLYYNWIVNKRTETCQSLRCIITVNCQQRKWDMSKPMLYYNSELSTNELRHVKAYVVLYLWIVHKRTEACQSLCCIITVNCQQTKCMSKPMLFYNCELSTNEMRHIKAYVVLWLWIVNKRTETCQSLRCIMTVNCQQRNWDMSKPTLYYNCELSTNELRHVKAYVVL